MEKFSVNWLLLPSAACNPDLLPTVTNAYWPYYTDNTGSYTTELVPGTTATIECVEGYHFPGNPVAMNTPEPTLPTTTAPPTPQFCELSRIFSLLFMQWASLFLRTEGTGRQWTILGQLTDLEWLTMNTTRTTAACPASLAISNSPILGIGYLYQFLLIFPYKLKICGYHFITAHARMWKD